MRSWLRRCSWLRSALARRSYSSAWRFIPLFSTLLSAPLAALAAAALVFLLSLLVIFLGGALSSRLARRARRARAKRGGAAFAFSAELGRILGEDAQKFIAGKPILALLVAVAGGFAIGASPRLRALLQALLKY